MSIMKISYKYISSDVVCDGTLNHAQNRVGFLSETLLHGSLQITWLMTLEALTLSVRVNHVTV